MMSMIMVLQYVCEKASNIPSVMNCAFMPQCTYTVYIIHTDVLQFKG